MYTLARLLTAREFLLQQAPTILAALGVAELFYKFHSFLLESGAFLVTWFVFDLARHHIVAAVAARRPS